ncbi:MAG: PD-(D/E)XK nuclease family protein [Limisphaerales bacterium]
MQARFLLGPAGSGKTFRCVAEVRAELRRAPVGPSLLFLAPKQATFQLERQLLAGSGDAALPGYSRLHILSFERLAAFVFAQLGRPVPELLSEEGRVMALRALLAREQAQLRVFRASARLTGFAAQLSLLLRELQRSRVGPARLVELAQRVPRSGRLDDKLHDLARLLEGYETWLAAHRAAGGSLEDANRLPDLATEALRRATADGVSLSIDALWLDGFAEMTPQEIALLAALAPHCGRMTLAFCLNDEPATDPAWLSPWAIVGRTFGRCRTALRAWPATVEVLPRDPARSRFSDAPELATLERALAGQATMTLAPATELTHHASRIAPPPAVRLIECPHAEAEATFAAREILRHVQAGGRFRDCAVLVRSLELHHDSLRRVLERYAIPFFLDRREPVAHHPLAELTRFALRTVTFDWRHEDWFGALKTGLVPLADDEVDALENEALRLGWQGRVWRETLPGKADSESGKRESRNPKPETTPPHHPLEHLRAKAMPPFLNFARALAADASGPTGASLVAAVRGLWEELNVERRLADWNERATELGLPRAAHETVWTQMNDWLANVERAFAAEAMPLREWLPVLEAGLAGLTVGAVPPALDQVLVGSVDRSRNPDLQRVFVLGVNEGVFPAPPRPGPLLTEADRLELEAHGVVLSANERLQIGHERYFGYIAFTRARRELVISWSRADAEGNELNPSPLVAAVQRALPHLRVEPFAAAPWPEAVHPRELEVPLLLEHARTSEHSAPGLTPHASRLTSALVDLDDFAELLTRWSQSRAALAQQRLSPAIAAALYGCELATSVSALEQFLGCPFHYVAARALRTEEREEFAPDVRQRGSFQHAVMEAFHRRVTASGRRWRDLAPAEARQLVREIGAELIPVFRDGLFHADPVARFTAATLVDNLARLVETLIGWTAQYQFDPERVEVSFGLRDAELPAWRIPLTGGRALLLRGRVDRVDLCRTPTGEALLVICDYKSSARQMDDAKLESGLEIQLLAYLAALAQMPEARVLLGADKLVPAGVFYVPLRGKADSAATRAEAAGAMASFQHRGRFDGAWLRQFDARGAGKGDQFRYVLTTKGEFAKRGNEALPPGGLPELLANIEARLRETGERIFAGEAAVSPYRLKRETACDRCAYQAVCRFDPWTMPFRSL